MLSETNLTQLIKDTNVLVCFFFFVFLAETQINVQVTIQTEDELSRNEKFLKIASPYLSSKHLASECVAQAAGGLGFIPMNHSEDARPKSIQNQ